MLMILNLKVRGTKQGEGKGRAFENYRLLRDPVCTVSCYWTMCCLGGEQLGLHYFRVEKQFRVPAVVKHMVNEYL